MPTRPAFTGDLVMNIAIPVARFHAGYTAEYVQRALVSLGHTASILDAPAFFSALRNREFDHFFCVDSGEALPLDDRSIASCSFEDVSFWFIDFRHNKNRPERRPNDLQNARLIDDRGGWVFQAQVEDVDDCLSLGLTRVSWLPLAADPDVWAADPREAKQFHIGFVGNVWDAQRKRALETLLGIKSLRVGFLGGGSVWKEDAAALLRRCVMGFNINSFFGEPFAYDINMRFFETLSCGIPIYTNEVPALERLLPPDAPFVRTFRSMGDLLPGLSAALRDDRFLAAGAAARQWILGHATYRHRMAEVLRRIEGAARAADADWMACA
jgi:hypothetical protein